MININNTNQFFIPKQITQEIFNNDNSILLFKNKIDVLLKNQIINLYDISYNEVSFKLEYIVKSKIECIDILYSWINIEQIPKHIIKTI